MSHFSLIWAKLVILLTLGKLSSLDGCFLDGCSLNGCFLDGGCLDSCFLDGCFCPLFSLCKTPLGETGCHYFLLTGSLSIQFFGSPLTQSVRPPTPHCAAPVWLAGRHVIPLVTRCFPPNLCQGKQRISLGAAIILGIGPYQDCKSFPCGEDFNKKHRAAATLISSHESVN